MTSLYAVAPAELGPVIGTLATFYLALIAAVGVSAALVVIARRVRGRRS